MLTYQQRSFVSFTWQQFLRKCSKWQIHKMSLKMQLLKWLLHLPGTNEFKQNLKTWKGLKLLWLLLPQVNAKYLAPLFLAYDDRLQEKDELIMHYEVMSGCQESQIFNYLESMIHGPKVVGTFRKIVKGQNHYAPTNLLCFMKWSRYFVVYMWGQINSSWVANFCCDYIYVSYK